MYVTVLSSQVSAAVVYLSFYWCHSSEVLCLDILDEGDGMEYPGKTINIGTRGSSKGV